MFASYEVATSFPSLTAIKGYHLDKSSDVPFNGTLCLKSNQHVFAFVQIFSAKQNVFCAPGVDLVVLYFDCSELLEIYRTLSMAWTMS